VLPRFGWKGARAGHGPLIPGANLDHHSQVAAHGPGTRIAGKNTEEAIAHAKRRRKSDEIDLVPARESRSKRNPQIGPDPRT